MDGAVLFWISLYDLTSFKIKLDDSISFNIIQYDSDMDYLE